MSTPDDVELPLKGLLVLDLSQFLAGPSAALRLADLGARVVKVERPNGGEAGRSLGLSDLKLNGDSLLFHTINRNKESIAIDLKSPEQLERLKRLVMEADVMIQGFRPGVLESYGLDYPSVHLSNPRLVYGSVSGYGSVGPWRDRPGQDLVVQAISGLPWLNGNRDDPPVAFGLSIVDTLAGTHLGQGILACLVRRGITGKGGLVEVSLLESAIDLQFEVLTTYLNDGGRLPVRSELAGAHPYLGAPYGIYRTADGYLALAMGSVTELGELIGAPQVAAFDDPGSWWGQRDRIKRLLAEHLVTQPTYEWLSRLEPAGFWCAEVMDWPDLLSHDGFKALDMLQGLEHDSTSIMTTRCPIRIDGKTLTSARPGPRLGEHRALPERVHE
ncbi:MAG: CoA transferase [Candidatus Dormibacteraeota bacterium]|uniref:CoA transferase n=1 Tax=Candidatus Dormiibacter inghamiae TaxID=3127013 RepID=A0A934KDL1_9BACT|nr:CoA transferase [Candidatus Dormibacteraeota bacterium]MBJ7606141.1 CoA transferase [Candidatus Dormibacteraeota bacterium]